jgi:tetratricopeptide (TPR) repeat protein
MVFGGLTMRNSSSKWLRVAAISVLTLGLAPVLAQKTADCPDVPALEAKVKSEGSVANLVSLGQGYLCVGKPNLAQATLEDALAIDYNNFDAHFYLGRALYELNDLDGALFEYNLLSNLEPERMEPYYQQGVILARLGKTDEAIKVFNKAIEAGKKLKVEPDLLVNTYLALASQQRIKKDYANLVNTYNAALELRPGDPTLLLGKAQALSDAGRPTEAVQVASSILNKDPGNVSASLLVADIYAEQGIYDRAIRQLNRSLEVVKDQKARALLFFKRGLIEFKAGKPKDAILSLTAATKANPDLFEAQYNLGVLLLPDSPSDALAHFSAAARLRPEDGESYLGIANAQESLKQYNEAYSSAKTALKFLKDDKLKARAQFVAGHSAYLNNKFSDASLEFQALSQQNPDNAQYFQWLGLSLYQLGDFTNSITAFQRAVTLDPKNIDAQVNLGNAYLGAKDWGNAENTFRNAVQAQPDLREALYGWGVSLVNLKRIEEGRVQLEKALKLGYEPARKALAALPKASK